MKKIFFLLILINILCEGCAGLGLNKKATLMPDEVWTQYEMDGDYKPIKYVGGIKWRLQ